MKEYKNNADLQGYVTQLRQFAGNVKSGLAYRNKGEVQNKIDELKLLETDLETLRTKMSELTAGLGKNPASKWKGAEKSETQSKLPEQFKKIMVSRQQASTSQKSE